MEFQPLLKEWSIVGPILENPFEAQKMASRGFNVNYKFSKDGNEALCMQTGILQEHWWICVIVNTD